MWPYLTWNSLCTIEWPEICEQSSYLWLWLPVLGLQAWASFPVPEVNIQFAKKQSSLNVFFRVSLCLTSSALVIISAFPKFPPFIFSVWNLPSLSISKAHSSYSLVLAELMPYFQHFLGMICFSFTWLFKSIFLLFSMVVVWLWTLFIAKI